MKHPHLRFNTEPKFIFEPLPFMEPGEGIVEQLKIVDPDYFLISFSSSGKEKRFDPHVPPGNEITCLSG